MNKRSPYMTHQDARGQFTGITNETWEEVNLIETYANQVRGGHYHRQTRELFYIVSGEIEVTVEELETGEKDQFTAKANDIFVIEPMHLHTFRTLSDASWLNMLNPALDPDDMDFHLIEGNVNPS